MDLLQITLIIVLITFTLFLIAVGIHLVLLLIEARQTLKKAGLVIDNTVQVTNALTSPLTAIAGIMSGLGEGIEVAKNLGSIFKKESKEN